MKRRLENFANELGLKVNDIEQQLDAKQSDHMTERKFLAFKAAHIALKCARDGVPVNVLIRRLASLAEDI